MAIRIITIMNRLNVSQKVAEKVSGLMRGNIDPFTFESVKTLDRQSYHPQEKYMNVMTALNELLEGCGVEFVSLGDDSDPRFFWGIEYVNFGDTYAPTICYNTQERKYTLSSWGDIAEQYM